MIFLSRTNCAKVSRLFCTTPSSCEAGGKSFFASASTSSGVLVGSICRAASARACWLRLRSASKTDSKYGSGVLIISLASSSFAYVSAPRANDPLDRGSRSLSSHFL
jgi:hypothetical protein